MKLIDFPLDEHSEPIPGELERGRVLLAMNTKQKSEAFRIVEKDGEVVIFHRPHGFTDFFQAATIHPKRWVNFERILTSKNLHHKLQKLVYTLIEEEKEKAVLRLIQKKRKN